MSDVFGSKMHSHTAGCLKPVAGGKRWTNDGDVEVPEPGWVKCSHNDVLLHQHAERLMAHMVGDRLACPSGVA